MHLNPVHTEMNGKWIGFRLEYSVGDLPRWVKGSRHLQQGHQAGKMSYCISLCYFFILHFILSSEPQEAHSPNVEKPLIFLQIQRIQLKLFLHQVKLKNTMEIFF